MNVVWIVAEKQHVSRFARNNNVRVNWEVLVSVEVIANCPCYGSDCSFYAKTFNEDGWD